MLPDLATLWAWMKKYSTLLVIVTSLGVLGVFKWQSASQIHTLQQEMADDDKIRSAEIKKIQDAHDAEIAEHQKHLEILEQRLGTIEAQYQAALKDLDEKKQQEIKQIIKDYSDDPDALAKKLSEATGIPLQARKRP